jgi:hypothetical protein
MALAQSAGFIARNSTAFGDYALGFVDYLLDYREIGQGFMDSGRCEPDTVSNLLIREFL